MNNSGGRKRRSEKEGESWNCLELIAIFLSYLLVILFFPLAILSCIRTVNQYERVVLLRLGRLRSGGVIGPGIFFYLPCIDEVYTIDMRTDSFDVPAQDILTKDSVTIRVDAIVYYRINDPVKSVLEVMNANEATEFLAQTTLRNVAGTKMLVELLSSRDQLSHEILLSMEQATSEWGVNVERVEVKEVTMPKQLQRAMAAEQEASRQAKAKIAAADGELQSCSALREASETMAQNPIALQLRYLQTLNTVSADKNHTIIVPFPLDVIRKLIGETGGSSPSREKGGGSPTTNFKNQTNENDNSRSNSKSVQTDSTLDDDLYFSSNSVRSSNIILKKDAGTQVNPPNLKESRNFLYEFRNAQPLTQFNKSDINFEVDKKINEEPKNLLYVPSEAQSPLSSMSSGDVGIQLNQKL